MNHASKTWPTGHKKDWLKLKDINPKIKKIIDSLDDNTNTDQIRHTYFSAIDLFQKNQIDILALSDLCEYLMGYKKIHDLLSKPKTTFIINFADVRWNYEKNGSTDVFVQSMIKTALDMDTSQTQS